MEFSNRVILSVSVFLYELASSYDQSCQRPLNRYIKTSNCPYSLNCILFTRKINQLFETKRRASFQQQRTNSTMSSAPVRRVITGHSPTGKAIITNDDILYPSNFFDSSTLASPSDFGLALLFRTEGSTSDSKIATDSPTITISNNVPFRDPYRTNMPIVEAGHVNWRIIDLPPQSTAPVHRTISLDLAVVLKGEVVLELDDGVETVLNEHNCLVQRGTIHGWHNRTEEPSRVIFVMLPSDAVAINERQVLMEVEMEV
jgi:quercetin dioxygenase-like cupin family protein